jgi:quercetin dioxygenase-like cupin family protein
MTKQSATPTAAARYFIRETEVAGYHPANHTGTLNKRLIGPDTVSARQLEVLVGQIEPGKGALPHAHPGIEQVCYMLQGRAIAEVDGQHQELHPGDCCFFPADMMHTFTVVGDEEVRVLVIYSPPYEEAADRVIRSAAGSAP